MPSAPGRPPIDPDRDPGAILDHARRRAICRLCRQRPATVREIATGVGAKPGAVGPMVLKLDAWNVIEVVGHSKRGAPKYSLTEQWRRELERWTRRHAPQFRARQRLVWIRPGGAGPSAHRFSARGNDDVEWAVSCPDSQALLIALEPDASSSDVARLVEELSEHGIACDHGTINDLITGDGFNDFVRGLRTTLSDPADG